MVSAETKERQLYMDANGNANQNTLVTNVEIQRGKPESQELYKHGR